MAYNYKIGELKANARYTVHTIDKWDGSTKTEEMDGASLKSFTNGCAHLYDIHAEEITEPQEPAEIMQRAAAVTLPQRVALYVPGTQGPATATDNAAQVERVAREFCSWYGGATAQQSTGYWMSDAAGLGGNHHRLRRLHRRPAPRAPARRPAAGPADQTGDAAGGRINHRKRNAVHHLRGRENAGD